MAILALIQSSRCFGTLTDLEIFHVWWESDPTVEEVSPVVNTHLWGHHDDPYNHSSTPATTFRIYWADGPTLANKLTLVQSEVVPPIADGIRWDRDDTLIPASSLVPPPGATHIIFVLDEDNLVQEIREDNNVQSFSLAIDFEVATPWPGVPYVPGIRFAFNVRTPFQIGRYWVPVAPTTAATLYWANGPTIQDRTSTIPIYSHLIEGPVWIEPRPIEVQVDASLFHDPPDGTTCVLLVLGPPDALLAAEADRASVSASDSTNKLEMLSTEKFLVAEVSDVRGTVSVLRDRAVLPLTVKDRVFHSDMVRTADKSLIKLRQIDGSFFTIGPNSELVIDKATLWPNGFREGLLILIKGSIRSKVEKQFKEGTEPSLTIKTKTVAIGVRGTEFEVEYEELDGVGTTRCTVFEGIVDITEEATGRTSAVAAGETLQTLTDFREPQAPIIGGWYLWDWDGNRVVGYVTFLPNGEYLLFQHGADGTDPAVQDGMERGTYTWDNVTGTFSAKVLVDTNGEWGFSHGVALHPSVSATVTDTEIGIENPGKDPVTFYRFDLFESPLAGSWYSASGVGTAGVAAVTFFADGSYYFTQDGGPGAVPPGTDGGELGTYVWDPGNGAFSATASVDTCGMWGLSHLGSNASVILENNDNTLILNQDNLSEPLVFYRVRTFDGSFESWNAAQALFGEAAEPDARPFPDGLPNLLRYALNLDTPITLPANLPSGRLVEISGNRHLEMEFRVSKKMQNTLLAPEYSTTLGTWLPVPAEYIHRLSDDDVSTERYSVRMPFLESAGFLRLSASFVAP